jgi:hypothetical protein
MLIYQPTLEYQSRNHLSIYLVELRKIFENFSHELGWSAMGNELNVLIQSFRSTRRYRLDNED